MTRPTKTSRHVITIGSGLLVACGAIWGFEDFQLEPSASLPSSDSSLEGAAETGAESGPIPVSSGCTSFADGYCELTSRCRPSNLSRNFFDLADCKRRVELMCANSENNRGAPRVPPSCGAAIKVLECNYEPLLGPTGLPFLAPQIPVPVGINECNVRGTLAEGFTCVNDLQCDSLWCSKQPGADSTKPCGKCVARVEENGECSNKRCAIGLSCDIYNSRACKKLVEKNSPCAGWGTCKPPYRCIGAKCSDPVPLDSPCTRPSASTTAADDLDPCDQAHGEFCQNVRDAGSAGFGGTGTCLKSSGSFAAAGEVCNSYKTPLVSCLGGMECYPPQSTDGGKCVRDNEEGESCSADPGGRCRVPSVCRDGKCALPDDECN